MLDIKNILKNPLLAGSMIMFIGSNFYNAGQFVFHFLSARMLQDRYGEDLGKAYYGDVASMISFWSLMSIVQLAFGLTLVRFVASEKNEASVKNFISWINYWVTIFSVVLGVLIIILSPIIGNFLNLTEPNAFFLMGPILLFSLILNSNRSVLQGLTKFKDNVLSLSIETVCKIALLILFLALGYEVFGVIGSILIAEIIAFLFTRYLIKGYLLEKRDKMPEIKPLLKYSLPVFIQGLALTSMYSVDLLLVKHFFSGQDAGIYAALSVLGRIVFFGASPITQVMFPLIVRRHSLGERYHHVFYLSLLLVLGAGGVITLMFYLFPELPLRTLYGTTYLSGSAHLWVYGAFMSLLSVCTLLIQFYLSVGKTRVVWFFAGAAILQGILIWINHQTILHVIQVSLVSVSLLLVALLVYYPYHDRKAKIV
jgi:O-antigen/teichoic acid export membrane protein